MDIMRMRARYQQNARYARALERGQTRLGVALKLAPAAAIVLAGITLWPGEWALPLIVVGAVSSAVWLYRAYQLFRSSRA